MNDVNRNPKKFGRLLKTAVRKIALMEDKNIALVQDELGFALRYDPEASQRVLDLTRGHPFLVQLLCSEIIALKNEGRLAERRLASPSDVEAAVGKAFDHGSFYFADIRHNRVDRVGLAVLGRLAAGGEGATPQPPRSGRSRCAP